MEEEALGILVLQRALTPPPPPNQRPTEAGTAGRVSACAHAPLQGDITIARHLCRVFTSSLYPDEDAIQAAQVDEWVDQAASFATAATKDIKTVLKALNMALGKVRRMLAVPA